MKLTYAYVEAAVGPDCPSCGRSMDMVYRFKSGTTMTTIHRWRQEGKLQEAAMKTLARCLDCGYSEER